LKRTKQVGVSFSESELKALKLAAFEADKSLSNFIRDHILKKINYKESKNG